MLAADETPRKRTFYERNLRRLAFLSPEIQCAFLEGRQPVGLILQALLQAEAPLGWGEQRAWVEQVSVKPATALIFSSSTWRATTSSLTTSHGRDTTSRDLRSWPL